MTGRAALAETLRRVLALAELDGKEGEPGADATRSERRLALVATLPPDVALAYEVLARAGRRPSVAPLRDGYCSACHLRIPPQVANAVSRGQELARCPHCRRMLYDPQSLGDRRA